MTGGMWVREKEDYGPSLGLLLIQTVSRGGSGGAHVHQEKDEDLREEG